MHSLTYTNGDCLMFNSRVELLRGIRQRYPRAAILWDAREEHADDYDHGVVFPDRIMALRLDLSLSGSFLESPGSIFCPAVATITSHPINF